MDVITPDCSDMRGITSDTDGGDLKHSERPILEEEASLVDTGDTLVDTIVVETSGRSLRCRPRRRLLPEKLRQKRQTLQDMARPLRYWLYHHRQNPYPTKSEKVILASGSQMTLTQVSNWFANARRRLKNTVRNPKLSWDSRIRLYNNHVAGNAELFSISSDDSVWESEDEIGDQRNTTFPSSSSDMISHSNFKFDPGSRSAQTSRQTHNGNNNMEEKGLRSNSVCKQTILQRYLSDSLEHSSVDFDKTSFQRSRSRHQSGSLGSRDYEELSTSSGSCPFNDPHNGFTDDFTDDFEVRNKCRRLSEDKGRRDDTPLKELEISAALALTSLARGCKVTGNHDTSARH